MRTTFVTLLSPILAQVAFLLSPIFGSSPLINSLVNPLINPLVNPLVNPLLNPLINPFINTLINHLINPPVAARCIVTLAQVAFLWNRYPGHGLRTTDYFFHDFGPLKTQG